MRHVLPPLCVLLALSGCASGRAVHPALESDLSRFSNAATVEVHLANFDFTPPVIHLRAGRPYRLQLVNDAAGGHDFTAPAFFAAARMPQQDQVRVARGKIEVAGGDSRIVHVIPAPGTYKVTCSHPGHALLGMTGRIVVD